MWFEKVPQHCKSMCVSVLGRRDNHTSYRMCVCKTGLVQGSQGVGLHRVTPADDDSVSFPDWWRGATKEITKLQKKDFNSLVILGAWHIWMHQNNCVFNGASPNTQLVVSEILEEAELWCQVGVRGLRSLLPWVRVVVWVVCCNLCGAHASLDLEGCVCGAQMFRLFCHSLSLNIMTRSPACSINISTRTNKIVAWCK